MLCEEVVEQTTETHPCAFYGPEGECGKCVTKDGTPEKRVHGYYMQGDWRPLAGGGLPSCHELVRGRLTPFAG